MRRLLPSLIAVVIVAIFSVFQRELLIDILGRLTHIHPLGFIPLFVAGACMVVARGVFLQSCSPGISLKHAITADQSALAAGYGIALGGGAVGTGLRIHMFTRWGLQPQVIASSIVATAVIPSFTTWGLPVLALLPRVINHTATDIQEIVVVSGVIVILISLVFWWIALRSERLFGIVGRVGHSLKMLLLRKTPTRFHRTRHLLERSEPHFFTSELRGNLRVLLRERGFRMLGSSLITLGAAFTCLMVSAWLFGAEGLTTYEALICFSLVRVLIALSPIPGAAGVAELGLIALLEQAGVSPLEATGTTLLYRFLTWFLPIVTGTVLWWRYSKSRKDSTHGTFRSNDQQLKDTERSIRIHV